MNSNVKVAKKYDFDWYHQDDMNFAFEILLVIHCFAPEICFPNFGKKE